MVRRVNILLKLLIVSTALFTTGAASAENFTAIQFIKIADSNTVIPGSAGKLKYFDNPSISNGQVLFVGYMDLEHSGIYSYNQGKLKSIVTTQSKTPTGASFTKFLSTASSEKSTIFRAISQKGEFRNDGIYSINKNNLKTIIDKKILIPNTSTYFSMPYSLSSTNNTTVFRATGGSDENFIEGIYTYSDNSLHLKANNNTKVPNTNETFGDLMRPSISKELISFTGLSNHEFGIFLIEGNKITTLANLKTTVPDTPYLFNDLGPSAISNGSVVFRGTSKLSGGLYISNNGTLSTIASNQTDIPEGVGTFSNIGTFPAISENYVVFSGKGSNNQSGIYIKYGSSLRKVIDKSDSLDGYTIKYLDAFDVDTSIKEKLIQVVFLVTFYNNQKAIYLANIKQ